MADPIAMSSDGLFCSAYYAADFCIGDPTLTQNAEIFIDTDDLLIIDRLRDRSQKPETFVNDAAVTAKVLDAAGATVASGIVLAYKTGSNGRYAGVLANTVSLTDGAGYTIEVTAIRGGKKLFVKASVTARFKRAS